MLLLSLRVQPSHNGGQDHELRNRFRGSRERDLFVVRGGAGFGMGEPGSDDAFDAGGAGAANSGAAAFDTARAKHEPDAGSAGGIAEGSSVAKEGWWP